MSRQAKLYKIDCIKRMKVRTAGSPLSQARLRQVVQGLAAREHERVGLVRYDPVGAGTSG